MFKHSKIRNAIIDKGVKLPHSVVGFDTESDRKRGLTITNNGIVVVPKGHPPEAFHE
ncbi:MAG: hypothetical protein U0798_19760 [Gemmataceae bacterium]